MPPRAGAEPPLLTRGLATLMGAHFLQGLGWSSLLLLPLFLGVELGASRTQIGLIMASAGIAGLVVRPIVAWALDGIGRKPTLIVGTVLTALGMAMLIGVDRIGPLLWASRLICGAGMAALFSGYFAFAADIIPARRRTEGLALFGVSGIVPLFVGPFAGELGVEPAALVYFLPAMALVVLLALLPLATVSEIRQRTDGGVLSPRAAWKALRRPALWPVWLATVLFAGIVVLFMNFVAVTAAARGIERPAIFWLSYGFGAIGVRLLGARLPDRIGPANLIAPALAAQIAAALVVAAATNETAFLVAGALGGLGHGMCFPVLAAQVVARSPDQLRGTAIAAFTALWEVATVALPPVYGAIGDRAGDSAMFSAGAVGAIAAAAIWAALEHRYGLPAPSEPVVIPSVGAAPPVP